MRFLVIIDYTDMEARSRTVDSHRAYLARGRADGKVVESGPFADGKGGMYILDVADEATADEFVDNDPYRKDGGLLLTVRRFA
jgi:uncharacterized protein YciI